MTVGGRGNRALVAVATRTRDRPRHRSNDSTNAAKKPEAPSVARGFENTKRRLPDTVYDMPRKAIVKLVTSRVTRGGQGSRALVAAKPLERLANGVQYPLAPPSQTAVSRA